MWRPLFRVVRRYWADWRRGSALDADIADELRFHVEMMAEAEASDGVTPAEAAARARRRFGRVDLIRDTCRDIRGVGAVEMLKQDLAFGFRTLWRAPAFTWSAILTLGLAIGAASAVAIVVVAILVRPLPYLEPDRLITVWQTRPDGSPSHVSAANWNDWATLNTTLSNLAAFSRWNFTIGGPPEAIRAEGAVVLGPFFEVLGVPAAIGRTFEGSASSEADGDVLVISHRLWRSHFGGDPQIVGRTVRVGSGPARIVGVMPAGFAYPMPSTDVWAPLTPTPAILSDRSGEWLRTLGRLKPGVSLTDARTELTAVATRLAETYPSANRGESVRLRELQAEIVGDFRSTLWLLGAATGALFLIACVNLSLLQLGRESARRRELALRAALGASRLRIARQLVTEGLLLVTAGVATGSLIAWILVDLFIAAAPPDVPRLAETAALVPRVAVPLLVGLAVGIAYAAFSLAPQARLGAMRQGAERRDPPLGRGFISRRTAMMIAQVAFSMMLVVFAGLLLRTFAALSAVDPGFNPDVMTVRIALPRSQYRSDAEQAAFFTAVVERVAAIRGVVSAGAISDAPMTGNNVSFPYSVVGSEFPDTENRLAGVRIVTPGYLETMQVRVLEGRRLNAQDTETRAAVAVVNRTFARRHWQQPLGQQLRIGGDPRPLTIVGVVEDVRQMDLRDDEGPAMYLPLAQKRLPFINWMTIVARGDAPSLAADIRAAVRSVDPEQPSFDARSMGERIAASIATVRLSAGVLSVLAVAAASLAIIGVYGTFAVLVSRRTREIGIRLAIGARPYDILRQLLQSAAATVAAGLLLGLAGAAVVARTLGSMLFAVTPADPVTYVASGIGLAAAALMASYIPAKRASQVDPIVTLKAE